MTGPLAVPVAWDDRAAADLAPALPGPWREWHRRRALEGDDIVLALYAGPDRQRVGTVLVCIDATADGRELVVVAIGGRTVGQGLYRSFGPVLRQYARAQHCCAVRALITSPARARLLRPLGFQPRAIVFELRP